jgi:hypothetical protein
MLFYLDLLSLEECQAVRAALYAMRNAWIPRNPANPGSCFTVGPAAYMDVCSSPQPEVDYYQRAVLYNALFAERLDFLYQRLATALAEYLGAPVRYADAHAWPGFHIFIGEAITSASRAPAHFDLQFHRLRWPCALDPVPALAFTLPIALPCVGGGLDVWSITPGDLEDAQRRGLMDDLQSYKERKARTFCPYTLGRLALHSGTLLHRIGAVSGITEEDERITLQGHGVRIDGTWILHW